MRSVQETKGSTYLKDRKWSSKSGTDKPSKRNDYSHVGVPGDLDQSCLWSGGTEGKYGWVEEKLQERDWRYCLRDNTFWSFCPNGTVAGWGYCQI